MAMKKSGLGKGLDLIFQENTQEKEGGVLLNINEIEPNQDQPRKEFDKEALTELAESIMKHGIIQPLLVRPLMAGSYQIVAGERRWRAARMAGLKEVPVLIREMDDSEYMQISLIENLQREDLTALEQANAFSVLMKEHGFTQEQVAKAVGKSRPVITNTLRLLNLPREILEMLEKNQISQGHARALLGFKDEENMKKAGRLVIEKNLSVRELENLQKKFNENDIEETTTKRTKFYSETEEMLNVKFGRKVKLSGNSKKGSIKIEFFGEEDLQKIIDSINLIRE